MSGFTPAATWGNARKVAGISDSRQVRDVKYGNLITYAKFPFLALMGGSIPGEDGKSRTFKPTIKSRAVNTLTPEIYDDEVAPTLLRLTSDSAAGDVGDSITLVCDDATSVQVDDTINNPGQEAAARVTAVSGSTITATVFFSAGGSVAWTADTSTRNLEVLAGSHIDGPTVGVGSYREMIQRTNGLQFMVTPMSQGILQKSLSLHGTPGGEGANQDWNAEKKRKMIDFNRRREMQHLLSQTYYTEGSGATRRVHAKGLIGWAGGVVPNQNADGALPWEDFINVHMASARAVGGGFDVYAFAGLEVATTLTSYQQKQIRVTNISETYKANVTKVETPAGNLHLITSDIFDSELRSGQMLTFMPDYLERNYLQNLDMKFAEGLEIANILGDRAAYMACECIMASNPGSIKLHTNIRKAA